MTPEELKRAPPKRKKGVRMTLRLPTEAAEQLRRLQSVYNLAPAGVVAQAVGKMYLAEPLAWPKEERA